MSANNQTDSAKQLVQDVLEDLKYKLTDVIFLVIQNDHKLMHRYLKLIRTEGVDKLNMDIGMEVKAQAGHQDDPNEKTNHNPRSTLIQTHTRHA